LTDLLPGTRFQPVLSDPVVSPEVAQRIVFLSGKIYYDLVKQRQSLGLNDRVAFIRIEELSPFPFHELKDTLRAYANAKQFVWVQEEPRNQGAWAHVASRLDAVLVELGHHTGVVYNGRKEASLPAPGIASIYAGQQKEILAAVFRDL
jgi:probable 2-oxoglutarate dehydrogenase E1 component DHKTD1